MFLLAVNVTASDGSLLWSRARGIITVDAPWWSSGGGCGVAGCFEGEANAG